MDPGDGLLLLRQNGAGARAERLAVGPRRLGTRPTRGPVRPVGAALGCEADALARDHAQCALLLRREPERADAGGRRGVAAGPGAGGTLALLGRPRCVEALLGFGAERARLLGKVGRVDFASPEARPERLGARRELGADCAAGTAAAHRSGPSAPPPAAARSGTVATRRREDGGLRLREDGLDVGRGLPRGGRVGLACVARADGGEARLLVGRERKTGGKRGDPRREVRRRAPWRGLRDGGESEQGKREHERCAG